MDSKQRRQRERLIANAKITCGYEGLMAQHARRDEKLQEAEAKLIADRAEFVEEVKIHREAAKEFRLAFQARADQLLNTSVIRDVLVALECDLDPIDIAAKIRKDFDLLTPQW